MAIILYRSQWFMSLCWNFMKIPFSIIFTVIIQSGHKLAHVTTASVACAKLWLDWIIVNTLRPRQNGRHFLDDIFNCIFLNENIWISNKISLKFVPKGQINNIPALVQIMAWRRPGDKPLFEPMMVSRLMHNCITRPQWVKRIQITNS